MKIRKLKQAEQKLAIALALDVFIACGKADYDEEGLGVFMSFIGDESRILELTFWGAFDEAGTLVGMLAMREKDHHLSMFSFIRPITGKVSDVPCLICHAGTSLLEYYGEFFYICCTFLSKSGIFSFG